MIRLLLFLCCTLSALTAEAQVSNAEQQELDAREFAAELERLAEICDRLGLKEQALLSRKWLPPTRDDRQLYYLPDSENWEMRSQANGESAELSSWQRHFRSARERYASHLYGNLLTQAKSDETAAYRLAWQTLAQDPNHESARQLLGELASVRDVRPRLVRGRQTLTDFGWPAGSYSQLTTPHFTLLTKADAADSLLIARQLEEFYLLWSQVFYPLWAPPGLLTDRVQGRYKPWPRHDRMRVVLLANRQEYLQVLGVGEENIGVSVGYYNPSAKTSFFYPAENLQATLFHELTHQLLLEATSIDARAEAGVDSGIWMLEGIALYIESFRQWGSYWSLGGWESPRMQTARYRAVRDGYWPLWSEFTSAGGEVWKADPAIARLYTHAAGLTHAFMNRLGDGASERFIQSLVGIYQQQNKSEKLLEFLGETEEKAKLAYQQLMVVTEVDVANLLKSAAPVQDLVLSGSQLSRNSWESLRALDELHWLDVSFSNFSDADLQAVHSLRELRRLSLEGTAVTGQQALPVAARLPHLQELDLSGCQVADRDLLVLRDNTSIKTLWLTNTAITNAALEILGSLKGLQSCDVQGSQIDDTSWRKFLQSHPQLGP
ncbi:MAG: hypothetical protein NXI32_20750 [bacterium]|nr:hypothetical protein [bacterium]